MAIMWPIGVLPAQNVSFDIASRSLSAPPAVSGAVQVVSSDAGIWKATFGNVIVHKKNAVLTFRAISTMLEGRLGKIIVPLCRGYQPFTDGESSGNLFNRPVPHSDGAYFSDTTGYVSGITDASTVGNYPVRAVQMTMNISTPNAQAGQHFSIGDRLYRIRTINYISPTQAVVTFRPPLREAVTNGARIEFDRPICRMRLATDDEMDLTLALRKFGNPTVNFIEDV